MSAYRAVWNRKDSQQPPPGARGEIFKASGYADPESVEYLAWMFVPDDEPEAAYYCDTDDLADIQQV